MKATFFARCSIFLMLLVFLGLGWDLFQRVYKPIPEYYALYRGKAYKMFGLNQPNLTTSALLDWTTNAATEVFTFNFYNAKEILAQSRKYFTKTGYINYLDALSKSKTIETVEKKQLAVYAVLTDNPIILREGPISGGGYAWQIQFPMLLTYESERASKQHIILTLLVTRVPTSESTEGIGIASFVVQEANRSAT